jgi:5-methyltetrahydrofolate--homocysteine methyltransferase
LKGVVGLFPANRTDDGEDVQIYASEDDRDAGKPLDKFCMLRQQAEKESDDPYLSQADFIAPAGYKDYMGMFAVSCFGCEALVVRYESEHDDYNKIMSQALADRFVEGKSPECFICTVET